VRTLNKIIFVIAAGIFSAPQLFACPACGSANADMPKSPLTSGMNLGILTLLGVLVPVLGCFAFGIVRMINKDEAANKNAAPKNITDL
jgi:hypothetical protein